MGCAHRFGNFSIMVDFSRKGKPNLESVAVPATAKLFRNGYGGEVCAGYRRAVLKYRSALSGKTVVMLPATVSASFRAAQMLAPELMPTSNP